MTFSDEEQKRIDRLPIILRSAVRYMSDAIHNIIYGNCDEEALTDAMATVNSNTTGRYSDADLLTYDTACKLLRIPTTNRAKLRKLCDRYGIKQVQIHNHKVGFMRSDILKIKSRMENKK